MSSQQSEQTRAEPSWKNPEGKDLKSMARLNHCSPAEVGHKSAAAVVVVVVAGTVVVVVEGHECYVQR